ncbi:MAG TPA: MinD/ParA family protein [Gammaproteobacteria bacterium]|nr:MinD/ParA family protein [Gammaproteobacteria bacterium]
MPPQSAAANTIAVTSGKGGVGKTSLATNLGVALSRLGHRVCLLDADMGLANVNILLGITPEYTIEDAIAGRRNLREVELSGPEGLRIIPAASGLEHIDRPGPALRRDIRALEERFDYLIVDTPAGIGGSTMSFLEAVDHAVLIITPEPTSLTDAFTLLKAMRRLSHRPDVSVVANMMPVDRNDDRLYTRFASAVQKHLGRDVDYLGSIAMDQAMTRAVLRQTPLLVAQRDAAAAGQIETLARRAVRVITPGGGAGRFAEYWCGAPTPDELAPAADDDDRVRAVITPPEETARATETPGAARPPASLTESAREFLEDDATEESDARRFFATVESAFSARFPRRTSDLERAIEATLATGALTRDAHRALIEHLEGAYRQRFGVSAETSAAADQRPAPPAGDDLADPEALARSLVDSPERSADRLAALLTALIGRDDWPEDGTRRVFQAMDAAFRQRSGQALQGGQAMPSDDGLGALRRELADKRKTLERTLTDVCLILEEHSRLEAALDRRIGIPSAADTAPGDEAGTADGRD